MCDYRSIIDLLTTCGLFACSQLWPSLFEVQSIVYEGSSYSVHLGRCRHFESYGSALRRGFDMCTFVLKRLEFFFRWKNWKSASLLISYFRTRIVYVLYGKLFLLCPWVRGFISIGYASFTFLYSLSILWSLAFARPKSFLASNLARLSCKCVL